MAAENHNITPLFNVLAWSGECSAKSAFRLPFVPRHLLCIKHVDAIGQKGWVRWISLRLSCLGCMEVGKVFKFWFDCPIFAFSDTCNCVVRCFALNTACHNGTSDKSQRQRNGVKNWRLREGRRYAPTFGTHGVYFTAISIIISISINQHQHQSEVSE